MSRRLVGGWWGASVACLAAKRVVCVVCFPYSAPPRRLKSPDTAARERLHPTGCGQARYVTDGDPIAKGAKDLEIPTINAWFQMYTVPLGSAKGWVRNADGNIEGESTTTAFNNSNQHDAEEARRERKKPSKQLGPELQIQNRHVHLVPIGLAGFVELATRAWPVPLALAGMPSCLSSPLSFSPKAWGNRGPVVERQRRTSGVPGLAVWSLSPWGPWEPWGPGHGDLSRCVGGGWRYPHSHSTPNDTQPFLVREISERVRENTEINVDTSLPPQYALHHSWPTAESGSARIQAASREEYDVCHCPARQPGSGPAAKPQKCPTSSSSSSPIPQQPKPLDTFRPRCFLCDC